jgi:sec-independent protein translocase protein TatC
MRKFFRTLWKIITAPFRALWWIISLPFRLVKRAVNFLNQEPSERPLTDVFVSLTESKEARTAFINEIEAFRKHLFRSLIALVLASIAAWFFIAPITQFLAIPIGGTEKLMVIDLTEALAVYLKITVMVGFAIAIPYIAFEFWLFAAPGLHVREKRIALAGIPLAALFFYGGVFFTYQFLLPPSIDFLKNYGNFAFSPIASKYYDLVTLLLFWIGLFFEFPLVIYILTSIGFVNPQTLAKQWRLAIIIIAILAAVITPTTDMGTMALVMAPMIGLYFISIFLSQIAFLARKRSIQKNQ